VVEWWDREFMEPPRLGKRGRAFGTGLLRTVHAV